MNSENRIVALLVESDAATRDRLGGWLEEGEIDAMACPGPSAPRYTCVQTGGGVCPLTRRADVVVLDLSMPGDALMEGTGSLELLGSYLAARKSVVALARNQSEIHPYQGEVTLVRWPPERGLLVRTVRRLGASSSGCVGGLAGASSSITPASMSASGVES